MTLYAQALLGNKYAHLLPRWLRQHKCLASYCDITYSHHTNHHKQSGHTQQHSALSHSEENKGSGNNHAINSVDNNPDNADQLTKKQHGNVGTSHTDFATDAKVFIITKLGKSIPQISSARVLNTWLQRWQELTFWDGLETALDIPLIRYMLHTSTQTTQHGARVAWVAWHFAQDNIFIDTNPGDTPRFHPRRTNKIYIHDDNHSGQAENTIPLSKTLIPLKPFHYYIFLGALLHDVGKAIGLRTLSQTGDKYHDDSYQKHVLKYHTEIGASMLPLKGDWSFLGLVARYHHAIFKPDFTYSPAEFSRLWFLQGLWLIAVSDVAVALKEKRSYRDSLSDAESMKILHDMIITAPVHNNFKALGFEVANYTINNFPELNHEVSTFFEKKA